MFISELSLENILDVSYANFSCLVSVYDNEDSKNFVRALINHFRPIYIAKSKWPAIGEEWGNLLIGEQFHETIKSGLSYLETCSVEKGTCVFVNEETLESSCLEDVLSLVSSYKVFFIRRLGKSSKGRINLRSAGKAREFVNTSIVLYPDNIMGYSTIDVTSLKLGKEFESKRYKLDNLKVRILAGKLPAPAVEDSKSKHALLQRLAYKAEDDRTKFQFLNEVIKKMVSRTACVSFVMEQLSCSEDQARELVRKLKIKLDKVF